MRHLKSLNWPVLLLALTITFALLLGGNALLQAAGIEGPLVRELKALPGVAEALIKGQELQVQLTADADLATTYQLIAKQAEGYQIKLLDDRDEALTELYSEVQFALFEGLQTGRYVEMTENVKTIAAGHGLTYHLTMDNQRLYLTAQHGEHRLFAVLTKGGQTSEHP